MRILALVPLLLATAVAADRPVSAQATAAQPPSFADAIAICRVGLIEHIKGGDGSIFAKALATVPADSRALVTVVCAAYGQGAADMLTIIQGKPEAATAI
jgi:hypothetical protein